MYRGTTPTLTFKLPFNVNQIKTAWVTFSQFGTELFTLTTENLTMSEQIISAKLTQEQTLLLNKDNDVEFQLRILTTSGDAIASNIMTSSVGEILKDGEIT